MHSRVESKSKAGTGLKLNGEWYNAAKGVSFDGINWKDNVEYTLDAAGKVASIHVVGNTQQATNVVSATTSTGTSANGLRESNTRTEIARSTAVKSVLQSPSFAQLLRDVDYSEAVSMLKSLIPEMTNYILTGNFIHTKEESNV